MQMKTRQELTKRIRGYLRDGTTALSGSETTHPTYGYICPRPFATRKRHSFSRQSDLGRIVMSTTKIQETF